MAQAAFLQSRLQQAVSQGAISLAEAWAFQDWMDLSPQHPTRLLDPPDCLQPMLNRLWLLEVTPHNQLKI